MYIGIGIGLLPRAPALQVARCMLQVDNASCALTLRRRTRSTSNRDLPCSSDPSGFIPSASKKTQTNKQKHKETNAQRNKKAPDNDLHLVERAAGEGLVAVCVCVWGGGGGGARGGEGM